MTECQPALETFSAKFATVEKVASHLPKMIKFLSLNNCVVQAKAKLPGLKAAVEEASAKLALAQDAGQSAAKNKAVLDLVRDTHAKQKHLSGVLCGRIVNDKGTLSAGDCVALIVGVLLIWSLFHGRQRPPTFARRRTPFGCLRLSLRSTPAVV